MGYKRTPLAQRKRSAFKSTLGKARELLKSEIDRLKGKQLIISSNIPLKQNGEMYADWARYKNEDTGVAIYFTYNGIPVSMCCDQYNNIWENIVALGKAIEAIRGLGRWGVSDFLNRAFAGFQALPEPSDQDGQTCWEILNHAPTRDIDLIKKLYKHQLHFKHPDKGGTTEDFIALQRAREQALNYANH